MSLFKKEIYRFSIVILVYILSPIRTMYAQDVISPVLEDKVYIDIGLEYGFNSGLGGNIGYNDLSVERGGLSLWSLSFLYKDDGIDQWGEYYQSIGQNQFPEDIIDTGYAYLTMHGIVGVKITKSTHALATIGYRMASYVQKRQDDFTILGNNGRYHTSYTDPDKSEIGAGIGVKFFLPMSEHVVFTPTIILSTLSVMSFSIGFAF